MLPKLTDQNVEDILYLAAELEAFNDRQYLGADPDAFSKLQPVLLFDMHTYFKQREGASRCETVCCAAGFAGLLPKFRDRGLQTSYDDGVVYLEGHDVSDFPTSAMRVGHFLGLTWGEIQRTFYAGEYPWAADGVTPDMVAERLREIVEARAPDAKMDSIKQRLEELRVELRAERISWGELAELQSLAAHIDPDDVELLEAAGVPEHQP